MAKCSEVSACYVLSGDGADIACSLVAVSAGAMGDSAYEYLLKQYLLSGRTEKRLLDMCTYFSLATQPHIDGQLSLEIDLDAMDGVINNLLYLSPRNDLLYMTDLGSWRSPT